MAGFRSGPVLAEPLVVPRPYRWISDAALEPSWWPVSVTDPRLGAAWALGSRQDDDGIGFVGSDNGPAAWVRTSRAGGPVARMDAVAVCGAVRRGVTQSAADVAAAGKAAARQVVIAANGYVSPLIGSGDTGSIAEVVDAIATAARGAGAVPVLLHLPAGDPLLDLLPMLGFTVGLTDLYASIDLAGDDFDGYLGALSSRRRGRIRREIRALDAGQARIVAGADAEPLITEASRLVASAYQARGQSIEAESVARIYRRLLSCFGVDFLLSVVSVEGEPVASACLLTARDTVYAYSAGLRLPAARTVAGYFNATYYLPLRHGYATGRRRLLLGPGTIEAKQFRGARFEPLFSAVPANCTPLATLLRRTDAMLRRRLAELPHR